jgi:hypothetical protein
MSSPRTCAPRCRTAPCSPPWACGGGSGLPAPPLRLPRIPRAAAALLSPSMPPLSTGFRFSMAAAVAPAPLPLWEADRPSPGVWHHRVLLSPPFLPHISDPVPICTFLMGCYFRRARAGQRGTMAGKGRQRRWSWWTAVAAVVIGAMLLFLDAGTRWLNSLSPPGRRRAPLSPQWVGQASRSASRQIRLVLLLPSFHLHLHFIPSYFLSHLSSFFSC